METYSANILNGIYTKILIIPLMSQASNCIILGMIMPFLLLDPIYDCKDNNGNLKVCNINEVCENKTNSIINLEETLINWTYKLNIECSQFDKVSIIWLYFLGYCVSFIFLSKLPDKYGRMKMFRILLLINSIALFFMFFNNILIIKISSFIFGFGNFNINVTYLILAEYYHKEQRGVIGSYMFFSFTLSYFLTVLISYSLRNIFCILLYTLITQVISVIIIEVWYIESPLWLYSQGYKEMFIEELRKVAEINNNIKIYKDFLIEYNKQTNNQFNEIKNQVSRNLNVFDLFKYKSIRDNFIRISCANISNLVTYYSINLGLEKTGSNIYALGFMISISDVVGFFITNYISDRYGRRLLIIIGLLGSSLFYLATLFISNLTFYALFLFISNTFTDILYSILGIYIPELFPTTIRSLACSNYYLLGRISTLFIPLMVYYNDYPQLFVFPMAIITSLIVSKLPETLGKPLKEDVEESEIERDLLELESR